MEPLHPFWPWKARKTRSLPRPQMHAIRHIGTQGLRFPDAYGRRCGWARAGGRRNPPRGRAPLLASGPIVGGMKNGRRSALLVSGLVLTLLSACSPTSPPSVVVPLDDTAPPGAMVPPGATVTRPQHHHFSCASVTCRWPDEYCVVELGGATSLTHASATGRCQPVPAACRSNMTCACLTGAGLGPGCSGQGQDIQFLEALP